MLLLGQVLGQLRQCLQGLQRVGGGDLKMPAWGGWWLRAAGTAVIPPPPCLAPCFPASIALCPCASLPDCLPPHAPLLIIYAVLGLRWQAVARAAGHLPG